MTAKRYADQSELLYAYDFVGRLSTFTNGRGQDKDFTYFLDGNVKKIDYEATNTPDVTYTYDANYDRVSTRADGAGTTSFVYHANDGSTLGAGQVARIDGPLSNDTLKYTYDALGRVAKMEIVDDSTYTTATYSEEYERDARARIEEITNNLGQFDYSYVGQSNRIDEIDYPNGVEVKYDYFGVSVDRMLKQIHNLDANGGTLSKFDYTYGQDRTIATWTIDQGQGISTWGFDYDGAMQLISAVRSSTATGVLEDEKYGYDRAGNRIQVVTGTTARNYGVNELNQLTAERGFGPTTFSGTTNEPAIVTVAGQPAKVTSNDGGTPYTFEALVDLASGTNEVVVTAEDDAENVTSQTYEVTTTGTVTKYEYDLDGNLRYEREPNDTVRREFVWDQENRLLKIVDGDHETEFEYDGLSRRVRIIETEGQTEESNHTFVWCASRLCQQRNSAGSTVEESYLWGGTEVGSTDLYYARDHLKSVREVVASNGTTVESRYDFSPWGEVTKTGGSGIESVELFTGVRDHGGSALMLAKYRAYSPTIGRWLSRDPIHERGGINLYGYAGNEPMARTDRSGLAWYDGPYCIGWGCTLPAIWDMCFGDPEPEPEPEPSPAPPPAPAPPPPPAGPGPGGPPSPEPEPPEPGEPPEDDRRRQGEIENDVSNQDIDRINELQEKRTKTGTLTPEEQWELDDAIDRQVGGGFF